MEVDYEFIAELFRRNNYHWKIGGEYVIPTAADIEEVFIAAKERIDEGHVAGEVSQFEIPHLLVRKDEAGYYNLFISVGGTND